MPPQPPNTEIEIKLYLPNEATLQTVQAALQAAGAVLRIPRTHERNIRYDDVTQGLTSAGRVLRLRQDHTVRLTYKEPLSHLPPDGHSGGGVIQRTEIEAELKTPADLDQMHLILEKLGFHSAWEYEKFRTTYDLDGCEIVLDETPIGHFAEIEGDPDRIERLVNQLGLAGAKRIHASYTELFAALKQTLALSVRDLTFANFSGVQIPAHFFQMDW
jgi:adenylate cyclase, class 2